VSLRQRTRSRRSKAMGLFATSLSLKAGLDVSFSFRLSGMRIIFWRPFVAGRRSMSDLALTPSDMSILPRREVGFAVD